MTATLIDGKEIAARIRGEIAAQVKDLEAKHGIRPGLAAVLVGENPASQQYVRMKRKACEEVGIQSFGIELPADTSQDKLEAMVSELNARPDVHGILVQLPLPSHLDEARVL
ncbi:MAG TPA: tetrahydrofolate dehydrogenase/cyclohydrolase catalytic domain-containing protein, partial [Aggregatilineales bacterium]|nr:tetrahydrofolate dehydrogenase/cyclohydrolase catalytic domain-containing protein [Aggregatilineales bacterium]